MSSIKRKKVLFLAEKPGVARDIAGALGKYAQKKGYLENESHIFTWALGHLAELAPPEDYDPSLKKWRADTLPIIPASFFIRPVESKKAHFRIVKSLLNRSDVSEVINACDAGREGEAIFRYIYHLAGCRLPHRRLWLSENTPAAIRMALARLESGMRYDFLFAAAQARARADWLVGMNATRAYTILKSEKMTVGRVQTPTLAILVEREREIRAFVPEIYWELWATFETEEGETYRGKWFDDTGTRFASREEALETRARVKGEKGEISSLDEKEEVAAPPPLYNLDDLQQDANRILGMTAARTLEVAQLLYERKKLITYPRTDSRYITETLSGTLPGRLSALSGMGIYARLAGKAAEYPVPKEIVNDAGVTDHHAILPTGVIPDSSLSGEERDIYDLVARRYLAVFFPPVVRCHTTVITKVNDQVFQSRSLRVVRQGWKEVYSSIENADDNGEDQSTLLPELREGQAVELVSAAVEEKKTRPPGRYTDATLLIAMKSAGKIGGRCGTAAGLGTPATRAGIIEKLIAAGYVGRRGKHLAPTGKGEELADLVPEELKSPQLTAQWEEHLLEIEQGKYSAKKFMADIEEMVRRVSQAALSDILISKTDV